MNDLLKILVVEDNPGDAALLENMLNEAAISFEMKCVERLSAGIQLLKSDSFDVILLDLGLPDSYGLETLRKLNKAEPAAPVIVLTGLADETAGTEAVKTGAQDYLIKGQIDKNQLSRAISHAIERKRSAGEIQAAAREWAACFDAMADGVSIHSEEHTILNANQSLLQLLGKSAEEVIGKKCYQIFHKKECPLADCPLSTTVATHQRAYAEIFEPTLKRLLAVSTSPIMDIAGGVTRIVHTVRDITDQRRMEEQLLQSQKMESIGTLAGGIAHDFNNILTAIIGYGEIVLMKMATTDPQHHNIEQILAAAERAAHLTRDLLLFSRKQTSEKMLIDLNATIQKVETFLKRVIREDIGYKTNLHQGKLTVLADSYQLEQVLINLATNARDAMPEGGVLTVTSAQIQLDENLQESPDSDNAADYACLTVADTGKGMDEETRLRIFEPFFTTKEIGKGTGLGLAVVFGIIKQHDGFIHVQSEPGKGTFFRIYLPLIAAESMEVAPEKLDQPLLTGTETILLAEDNELVRQMTLDILAGAGYTVIAAADGAEAVSRFVEHGEQIDLLLFDLIMPKMNGKAAYDEIRKLRPEVKVIFVSGYTPDMLRDNTELGSTVDLIAKPASPLKLLGKIRTVLDGR